MSHISIPHIAFPSNEEQIMGQNKMHDIEKMIAWFMELDKDKDGNVDRRELSQYYRGKGVSTDQVDKWMDKFDFDDNGKVSLNEFCRGLGVRVEEMRLEQRQRQDVREGKAPQVSPDIEVVASTMNEVRIAEVTEKFKDIANRHGQKEEEMREVAHMFKAYLDETYGRVWQCVILTGSYWMHFSHEPFLSIQFKYGKYICLAWRTPQG